jgi:hypothetical protein
MGAEVALAVVLAGLASRRRDAAPTAASATLPREVDRGLWLGFTIVLALAVLGFVLLTWHRPHGRWDAWMIWNARARFVVRAGEQWKDVFTDALSWSHPDYPLGLPLVVANLWTALSSESLVVPAAVALVTVLGTASVLLGTVERARSRAQALLAVVFLLGTHDVIRQGSSQYADVPVGFFFTAATALLCLRDAGALGDGAVVLAGLCAGFAAWTKNEGVLFLGALVGARFVAALVARDLRRLPREALLLAAGALVPVMTLTVFKLTLAPVNDLVQGQAKGATVARLKDLSRYRDILYAFQHELVKMPIWIPAIWAVALGLRPRSLRDRSVVTVLAVLALMAAGYFLVYVTTPMPLEWHLRTSMRRLLTQLWPLLALLVALVTRTPEEAFARVAEEDNPTAPANA